MCSYIVFFDTMLLVRWGGEFRFVWSLRGCGLLRVKYDSGLCDQLPLVIQLSSEYTSAQPWDPSKIVWWLSHWISNMKLVTSSLSTPPSWSWWPARPWWSSSACEVPGRSPRSLGGSSLKQHQVGSATIAKPFGNYFPRCPLSVEGVWSRWSISCSCVRQGGRLVFFEPWVDRARDDEKRRWIKCRCGRRASV